MEFDLGFRPVKFQLLGRKEGRRKGIKEKQNSRIKP